MILACDTSHKGYLRMGKILRLLGDNAAALQTYEMGMRRARTGVDDIAQHVRALKIGKQKKAGKTDDPFALLPFQIGLRILSTVGKNREIYKIAQLSEDSAACVRRYFDTLDSMIILTKSKSMSDILKFIQKRPSAKSIRVTAASFEALLKLSQKTSIPNKFNFIQFTGYFGALANADHLPSIFDQLERVVFSSSKITRFDVLNWVCQHHKTLKRLEYKCDVLSEECQDLFGQFFKEFFIASQGKTLDSFKLISNSGFPTLCHSEAFLACIGDVRTAHVLVGNNSHGILAVIRSSRLTDVALPAVSLDILKNFMTRPGGLSRIRKFKLISNHLDRLPSQHLDILSVFAKNLHRLHLKSLFIDGSVAESFALHFPRLSHLLIDSVHPLIYLSRWAMPKLETLCFANCEMISAQQLPNSLELRELYYTRKSMFMHAAAFQRLANAFQAGKIHVLGISDAHQFYHSNGMQRIYTLNQTQPLHHVLISEPDIVHQILRIWPAEDLTINL